MHYAHTHTQLAFTQFANRSKNLAAPLGNRYIQPILTTPAQTDTARLSHIHTHTRSPSPAIDVDIRETHALSALHPNCPDQRNIMARVSVR